MMSETMPKSVSNGNNTTATAAATTTGGVAAASADRHPVGTPSSSTVAAGTQLEAALSRFQGADAVNQGVSRPASPTGSSSATATTNRKRVFTFQKRWLHSLPIMEKILPDSALDAASVAALKAANLLGDDGKPVDDATARDVVVCMLCDDPHASRESLKIWSRLNCRRGRIENHLTSKHPEFMLLLKHKRETDGDLAVQIFLQDMREGRCNVRNEISAGLYSHMQQPPLVVNSPNGGDLSHSGTTSQYKRALAHDDFMMPGATAGVVAAAQPYHAKPLEVACHKENLHTDAADHESRRSQKRVKTHSAPHDPSTSAAVTTARLGDDGDQGEQLPHDHSEQQHQNQQPQAGPRGSLLHASLLSYHGPAAFTQWRTILTNKTIVITGGENAVVARVATNLWLLGANILITFAELGTMEAFATSYLAQFHAMEGVEPPRGVMLPLFCSLQTRAHIDEWSRSIGAKFDQVDFLVNFVDANDADTHHDGETASASAAAGDHSKTTTGSESISSNETRARAICEIFSAACMQSSRRGAIINLTTQADPVRTTALCTAIETTTTSLAQELLPTNVQVNCLVLEQDDATALSAQLSAEQDLALLHSMLFLMSPASTAISGSVLRQRRRAIDAPTLSPPAAAPATGSPPVAAATVPATHAQQSVAVSSQVSTQAAPPTSGTSGSSSGNGSGHGALDQQVI